MSSYTADPVVKERLKLLGFLTDMESEEAYRKAMIDFKGRNGLLARDYIGPITMARLFSETVFTADTGDDVPPWYTEMWKHKGLHELTNHAELISWLKSDGKTLGDPAKLPWCGDAMQTAFANTLPNEKLPTNPYLARNWVSEFGITITAARIGAVLVFHNGDPSDPSGHIALCAGQDVDTYHCLGGNQSNSVSLTRIRKNRLRQNGMRWPETYPLPPYTPMKSALTGAISTSER